MQYNYQKHVKLFKDANKLKYLELKGYSLQINEHLHWSNKEQYLQLIKKFLSFKINGKTFESKFCNMVEAIYFCCYKFYPDFDEKDPPDFPFAKNEENFRDAVADIFPRIILSFKFNTHTCLFYTLFS